MTAVTAADKARVRLESLIQQKITGETAVYPASDPGSLDAAAPLHPEALAFYNDCDPLPEFAGFTKSPIFETHLMVANSDEETLYRLERFGPALIFSVRSSSSGNGTYHVYGQALLCDKESIEEALFTRAAVDAALKDIAAPLREAWDDLSTSKLGMDGNDLMRAFTRQLTRSS